MPLSVNVGLSRKVSKDYQSSGVSINLTAELDQSLLARPEELQRQVEQLYLQANLALDHQVPRLEQESAPAPTQQPAATGNGHAGKSNGSSTRRSLPKNGNGHSIPPMTASQQRAIGAIGRRLELDIAQECHGAFGWDAEQLNIRQASQFIDHLRGMERAADAANPQAQGGNGSSR